MKSTPASRAACQRVAAAPASQSCKPGDHPWVVASLAASAIQCVDADPEAGRVCRGDDLPRGVPRRPRSSLPPQAGLRARSPSKGDSTTGGSSSPASARGRARRRVTCHWRIVHSAEETQASADWYRVVKTHLLRVGLAREHQQRPDRPAAQCVRGRRFARPSSARLVLAQQSHTGLVHSGGSILKSRFSVITGQWSVTPRAEAASTRAHGVEKVLPQCRLVADDTPCRARRAPRRRRWPWGTRRDPVRSRQEYP